MLKVRVGISQQHWIGHKLLEGLAKLVTEQSLGESSIHYSLSPRNVLDELYGGPWLVNGIQTALRYSYVSSQAHVSHFAGTSAQVQSCSRIGAKTVLHVLGVLQVLDVEAQRSRRDMSECPLYHGRDRPPWR